MQRNYRARRPYPRKPLGQPLPRTSRPATRQVLFVAGLILGASVLAVMLFASVHASLATSSAQSTPASGQPIPLLSSSPSSATPDQVRTGVFSLADGGPVPVPTNVFHPVNVARTVLDHEIYSIYAGWMTRQPALGALVVLQTNELSGQQSLHTYQTPQPIGALTIQRLQNQTIIFTAEHGQGNFDLLTGQFQLT